MPVILQYAVGSLTGAAGFSIVAFLARNWIVARLTASITHEYNVELSKVNAKLDVLSSRDKFAFEQYHLRYLEVLSECYGRLWYAASMYFAFMNPGNGPEQFRNLSDKVNEAWTDFSTYFNQKRLWLPDTVDEEIEQFRVAVFESVAIPFQLHVVNRMLNGERKLEMEAKGDIWREGSVIPDARVWSELTERMRTKILPEIRAMGDRLRRRLAEEVNRQSGEVTP